jgi:hypothetical protein
MPSQGGKEAMSKTPRTDAAAYPEPITFIEVVGSEFARRLESDLGDCLATLESVRDYLQCGQCLCDFRPESENVCGRCRMLDDVETTLKNCKP